MHVARCQMHSKKRYETSRCILCEFFAMFFKWHAILRDGNSSLMHSRNYEISSLTRRAEMRRARNSDGKSLLFQRNSLCPKERCKKSWVAALTNYCQSHSSHSAASFLSNCEMGTYIRRMGVLADRHFPLKTSSHWNIGGFAILAVIFTLVFSTTEARDMKFSLPHMQYVIYQLIISIE